MKIIFLSGKNPFGRGPFGGAESSIGLLAIQMIRQGHTVFFVSSELPEPDAMTTEAAGIQFFRFRKFRGAFSPITKFLTDVSIAVTLRQALKTDPDIIYCSYEPNILAALVDYKWISGRRGIRPHMMLRIAGEYWSEVCDKKPEYKAKFERWFRNFDNVNYISGSLVKRTAELLGKHGMDVSFSRTLTGDIGSGVPVGRKTPYQAKSGTTYHIAMAARFSDYAKRQDLLIQAVARLKDRRNIRISFFGEGPRKSACEKLAVDLGISDFVVFEPFIVQKDLWEKFQDMNLVCHISDHEGLCKTVIEAMAVGAPVLCSDIAPFNEYVIDGENGFLVAHEVDAIAMRIESLMKQTELLTAVSIKSMQTIRERFDPERNILAYERSFLECINNDG